jgi:hypothetical protein
VSTVVEIDGIPEKALDGGELAEPVLRRCVVARYADCSEEPLCSCCRLVEVELNHNSFSPFGDLFGA